MSTITSQDLQPTVQGESPDISFTDNNSQQKPTFNEEGQAAFRLFNPIRSFMEARSAGINTIQKQEPDANYNPFDQIIGTKYEEQADAFVHANSDADVKSIQHKIDQEESDRETLAKSGLMGTGLAFMAGLLSPDVLIPGVDEVRILKGSTDAVKATRLINSANKALHGAVTGGMIGGIHESLLKTTQLTKTNKEVLYNTYFSMLAGGILGGTIGALQRPVKDAVTESLQRIDSGRIKTTRVSVDGDNFPTAEYVTPDGSVGSAESDIEIQGIKSGLAFNWLGKKDSSKLEEIRNLQSMLESMSYGLKDNPEAKQIQSKIEDLIGSFSKRDKLVHGFANFLPFLKKPHLRGLTSVFPLVRQITNRTFSHAISTIENTEGVAYTTVEGNLIKTHPVLIDIKNYGVKKYMEYVGLKPSTSLVNQLKAFKKGRDSQYLSLNEFSEEVSKAMDAGGEHHISEVAAVADHFRNAMTPFVRKMQELDILSKDIPEEEAATYFPRVFDVSEILNRREEFTRKLQTHYKAPGDDYENYKNRKLERSKVKREINLRSKRLYKDKEGAHAKENELKLTELNKRLPELEKDINDLEKNGDISKPIEDPNKSYEYAKETVQRIVGESDNQLSMLDLIRYVGSVKSQFTKARKLKIGFNELQDFLVKDAIGMVSSYINKSARMIEMKKLMNDFGVENIQGLQSDLLAQKDELVKKYPNKQEFYNKAYREDRKFIEEMLASVNGTVRVNPGSKGNRFLSGVKKLQVLTKLGNVTMNSVFPDVANMMFRQGVSSVFKDGLVNLATNFKTLKATTDQLKDYGLAVDTFSNEILASFEDGSHQPGANPNKLTRLGDKITAFYGKVSLLNYWDAGSKRVASFISLSKTMRSLEKYANGETLSQAETSRLAELGIGERHYKRIWDSFVNGGGSKTDGAYSVNFEDFEDAEAASVLALSAIKEANLAILTPGKGDIPMFVQKSGLGSTVFQFRSFSSAASSQILLHAIQHADAEKLTGVLLLLGSGYVTYMLRSLRNKKKIKTDLPTMISEGLTNSSLLGLMGDYAMALNPWSSSSRWANLDKLEVLFGPSFSSAENVLGVTQNLAKGDIEKAWGQFIHLLPFNNISYIHPFLAKIKGS